MNSIVDEPLFPITIIAALIGVRLALSAIERLNKESDKKHSSLAAVVETPASDENTAPLEGAPVDPIALQPDQNTAPAGSRLIIELLDAAVIAFALVFFLIRPYVIQTFYIPTNSMTPTLQVNDMLIAAKYVYKIWEPHRGEVVVFTPPTIALELQGQRINTQQPIEYVKRVIGLPNDHIRIVAGQGVWVNGSLLPEPYLHGVLPDYNFPSIIPPDNNASPPEHRIWNDINRNVNEGEFIVPPGCLFVLGDNRSPSFDSHKWGVLDQKRLIGKALFIFYPFNHAGIIH